MLSGNFFPNPEDRRHLCPAQVRLRAVRRPSYPPRRLDLLNIPRYMEY